MTLAIVSILLLSLILISQTNKNASGDLLQADRSEIKLRMSTDDAAVTAQELIIGVTNTTNLNVITTDLFDEREQRIFESSNISVSPTTFDLNTRVDSGTKVLDVTITSANSMPGVYLGKLYIINPSTQFTIPITLTIHYPIWQAFAFIAAGILVGFFVKLIQKFLEKSKEGKSNPQVQKEAKEKTFGIVGLALSETVNKKGWAYLGMTALVVIAIFTAWQGYYSNLVAYGRSPLMDVIAAFLFGFGSQAVVNQAIEMLKRE